MGLSRRGRRPGAGELGAGEGPEFWPEALVLRGLRGQFSLRRRHPSPSRGWARRGLGARAHVVAGSGCSSRKRPLRPGAETGEGGPTGGIGRMLDAGRGRPTPCALRRACLSKGPAGPPGARGQQLDPALPPLASCRSHEVPTPRAPTGRRALGRGPAPPRAARPVPRGGRSGAGAQRFFPSPSNHRPPLCWRFLSRGQPERLRILDRLSEASGALGKRSERPGLCPSLPSLSAFVPAQPATGDSF